jgi:hypothetical protein
MRKRQTKKLKKILSELGGTKTLLRRIKKIFKSLPHNKKSQVTTKKKDITHDIPPKPIC